VSVDSLEYFAGVGHPHVHGSRALFSAFIAHLDASVAAVTAAGNRRPASSALRVPAEGTKTTHRAALFFVQPRTVTLWQKRRFRDLDDEFVKLRDDSR
jgi:hypothetical protein